MNEAGKSTSCDELEDAVGVVGMAVRLGINEKMMDEMIP